MAAIASPTRTRKLLRGRSGRALPARARRLLGLNAVPHPRWLNILPNAVTLLSKGGALWVLGALGAAALRIPGGARALRELLPSLLGATLLVEYALKRLVRRPRPRSARLRALVLRRQPSSSFPSGDAAAAFAGAWLLGTVWPRLAPVFLAIAGALGYARVRVGAHHASDVAAGAALGVVLAELIRRGTRRLRSLLGAALGLAERDARNAAAGAFGGSLLALGASALSGFLGTRREVELAARTGYLRGRSRGSAAPLDEA